MTRFRLPRSLLGLLLTILPLLAMAASEQELRLQVTGRVIVVGDIHGDFDEFTKLIRAAGIVDDELSWQAGRAHLVSVGDLLDRGPDSRKVMDLFMRLETQAASAGGAVHLVLGNHELMNLVSDLRYVTDAEYLHFQVDENPAEREKHWQQYLAGSPGADPESLLAAFNRQYPPGYFGHIEQFAADGNYGRWLLSKPTMLMINGVLFVHGGLSPELPLTTL